MSIDVLHVLDGDSGIMQPSICKRCKHYDAAGEKNEDAQTGTCKAFERIPKDIWLGNVLHRAEYEGDQGFRFEMK